MADMPRTSSTHRINRDALVALRERSGMTLRQLAEAANIHFAYLSQIEAGDRQPSAAVIKRIAAGLAVPTTALLGGDE
jgi:transcriptional regulator with XRE-family HTH domain